MGPRGSRMLIAWGLAVTLLFATATIASAGTVTLTACSSGSQPLNTTPTRYAWENSGDSSLYEVDACQGGGRMQIGWNNRASPRGAVGQWTISTPPDMSLASVSIPDGAGLLNPYLDNIDLSHGTGYEAFVTADRALEMTGGPVCCGGLWYSGLLSARISGRDFEVQVVCVDPPSSAGCSLPAGSPQQLFDVKDITLTAEDDVAPTISASPALASGIDLWNAGPWVRGAWNLWFTGSNGVASGVCDTRAFLDGQRLPGDWSQSPDQTEWMQCNPTAPFSDGINTANLANGVHALGIQAVDAATPVNAADENRQVGVDNMAPTISLPGRQDFPGNGSTVYVTATATAGPSGVRDIDCVVDGGSHLVFNAPNGPVSYSAQVPVTGLGLHHVSCVAQNNAADNAGYVATTAPATSTVTLREPTSALATFGKIVGKPLCRTVTRRIHGRRRRVRTCRDRTIKKHEVVVIRRHGRKVKVHRTVRVRVRPHFVLQKQLRVKYGRSAVVRGSLSSGAGAVSGAPISILAAPDNRSGAYRQIASTVTGPDGSWAAKVRAGPGRLIKAVYDGSDTQEPAMSTPVRLVVPAKVVLHVKPSRTHWGGRVRIYGRLKGGYIPAGGEVVVIRIAYRGGVAEIGHVHTTRKGRFSLRYHFLNGSGHVVYRLWAQSLAEGDYPYAPGRSRDVAIHVNG